MIAFAAAAGLILATSVYSYPVLVEIQQIDSIAVSGDSVVLPVITMPFGLDTTCLVQFSVNAVGDRCVIWLEMDGVKLYPIAGQFENVVPQKSFGFTYTTELDKGNHYAVLKFSLIGKFSAYDIVLRSAYLQALIFQPEKPSYFSESPGKTISPSPSTIMASGSYISIPNAKSVSDISGRAIPNILVGEKVFIRELPKGIYFVKSAYTVTKVVKL